MSQPTRQPDESILPKRVSKSYATVTWLSYCRQCGERASWWDEVCTVCGTADPVHLPTKWLVYAATILVVSGIAISSLA